jgi:chromosome partitioning protein
LRFGLEEVRGDYDVIILDPPPAMGFLGVNTHAADGLLIPVPARQLDYLSTIHFMQTCREALELISKFDPTIDYGFIRVVCTMFQPNRTNEAQMFQVMEKTYAGQMIKTPILLSEEIKNAGVLMSSIYEVNKHGSHQPSPAALPHSTPCLPKSSARSASNGPRASPRSAPTS